jgi:hypothetical protein
MKLYHYAAKHFESIDMAKCDGFWMTTISPAQSDMIDEIGASESAWVAVCELDDSGEMLFNGQNSDVSNQLTNESADFLKNAYDGFSDYAVSNPELVKIIEWIKL